MVPTMVIILLKSITIRGYFILYQKDNANVSFWFWQQILPVRRQPGRSSQVREQGGAKAVLQVKTIVVILYFHWIDERVYFYAHYRATTRLERADADEDEDQV